MPQTLQISPRGLYVTRGNIRIGKGSKRTIPHICTCYDPALAAFRVYGYWSIVVYTRSWHRHSRHHWEGADISSTYVYRLRIVYLPFGSEQILALPHMRHNLRRRTICKHLFSKHSYVVRTNCRQLTSWDVKRNKKFTGTEMCCLRFENINHNDGAKGGIDLRNGFCIITLISLLWDTSSQSRLIRVYVFVGLSDVTYFVKDTLMDSLSDISMWSVDEKKDKTIEPRIINLISSGTALFVRWSIEKKEGSVRKI